MKIHILQHVAFEGPANILNWAQMKGHNVESTLFYEPGWFMPATDSMDMLVVMGGPMGVHEEGAYPWMAIEKSFIKDCIAAGCKVVGICLGAQLAAEALGARVYPNKQKEIGWFPIHKTSVAHPVFFDMNPSQPVFHWHSDTFDLPAGALHLATSDACVNQAFMWNEQVFGLQFHMEMSSEHIETLLENSFQDKQSEYVQSDTAIRDGYPQGENLPPLMDSVLTRFVT